MKIQTQTEISEHPTAGQCGRERQQFALHARLAHAGIHYDRVLIAEASTEFGTLLAKKLSRKTRVTA
jgi:hypothetical protein